MQMFFSSLTSLEHFTHALQSLTIDNACKHCSKNDQWVGHGYIYKRRSIEHNEVAGKRILCSQRYGKNGCGRTRQLYLESFIPRRHYTMRVIIAFIIQLLEGANVVAAYHQTTRKHYSDPRNAWRWVRALYKQLGHFRSCLNKQEEVQGRYASHRSRRLAIVLPTLHALFDSTSTSTHFQFWHQCAFF